MNYFLGVELNGSLLKIAAFKRSRQLYELLKLDSFNIQSEPNEATKQLTVWIDHNLPNPTSIKVVLTISESTLYIKEMEFPKMEKEKLNEAIYWEIPSIAPIPQADAVYDWQIISEEKGTLNTLVIVGKSNFVQNIISIFRNAQMDIVAIEPSSYAFARIANVPLDTNTLLCLVQEHGTDFIILKNGIPFFTTSTTGNTQSEKVLRIKSGTDLTAEIVAEGKKIISYWEGKESLKIHQVVVAGDMAYKYFGLSVSLNLFPPTPSYVVTLRKVKDLKVKDYKDLEILSFLISIGAVLRYQQKDVLDGINLFPPVEKQKTEKVRLQKEITRQLMTFLYANTAVLLIFSVTFLALNIWWYSLEGQLDKLNRVLVSHSGSTLIEEINKTNSTIENVISLTKDQEDFGAKLRTISDSTPQTIKLTSVNFVNTKSQEWVIEGTGDRDSILAFYKMILQKIKTAKVGISYNSFNKSLDNKFSISITW